MENKTSGQLIRFFRERSGLTQGELASIIEVSSVKLSHWENDETVPKSVMIAGIAGALGLSSEEEAILEEVAAAARAEKKQEQANAQAREQAIKNAEFAEAKRLNHKRKALRLFVLGVIGFVCGFIFVLVSGSSLQNLWYAPFVIGAVLAGVPYGWGVLTSKGEPKYSDGYTPNRESYETSLLIKLIFYVLKFIGAIFIGVFGYPIALSYHAFKAGKKGSIFRGLMLVALIIAIGFTAVIAGIIILSSTTP